MDITAILLLWASLYFPLITAGLVPRQTLPPGHFFVQATSTDPTVNGKFAFIFAAAETFSSVPRSVTKVGRMARGLDH